jgi:hypothetical protein
VRAHGIKQGVFVRAAWGRQSRNAIVNDISDRFGHAAAESRDDHVGDLRPDSRAERCNN